MDNSLSVSDGSDPSTARIVELLLEVGVYTDKPDPVILNSGLLSPFFINTENLLEDDGAWKQFGEDPVGMDQYVYGVFRDNPNFRLVIGMLADRVYERLRNGGALGQDKEVVITGGQRRDWIFSAPVAHELGFRHVALFKDGRPPVDTARDEEVSSMDGMYAHHVVDLVTYGESILVEKEGQVYGWIPQVASLGGEITDVTTVVDRNQGGRERLATHGIELDALVLFEHEVLRRISAQPDVVGRFLAGDDAWTREYARSGDIFHLGEFFSPDHEKPEKAKRFSEQYGRELTQNRRFPEFVTHVGRVHGPETQARLLDLLDQ